MDYYLSILYMPYKKKGYRKNYRRKSTIPTYGACASKLAADGLNLYKLVKPFLPFNAEYKQLNNNTSSAVGTTVIRGLKNGTVQGTDQNERIGRSVRMTSVHVKQQYKLNVLASTPCTIRCSLVIDSQANGIIFPNGDYQAGGYSLISMYNSDQQGRFKTLLNWNVNLSPEGRQHVVMEKYIRIPREWGHIEYNSGVAGTIADINKNSLYLILLSDDNVNKPQVESNVRVNYVDN